MAATLVVPLMFVAFAGRQTSINLDDPTDTAQGAYSLAGRA